MDAPWDTPADEFNSLNVLYDPEEKLFKMWYVVIGQRKDEYWERGRKTAYATSTDGIHWTRHNDGSMMWFDANSSEWITFQQ
mgnify:CR=1 FL=1